MTDSIVNENISISVVIPTLGGEQMIETIKSLNSGTIKPTEILICIPDEYSNNISNYPDENVLLVKTQLKGQVVQRSIGFQKAKCEIVLQLDDDIILASDCIEKMYRQLIKYGPAASISPALYNLDTKNSVYAKPKSNNFFQSLYYFIINGKYGYKMGSVDLTGSPIGVDPQNVNLDVYPVEWLPGGCVMHFKSNLVLVDYFPLKGKAYCEDLIHSYLLKENKINLLISLRAKAFIKIEKYTSVSILDFVKSVKDDYRARKYYLSIKGRLSKRIFVFYTLMIINYISSISQK